MLDISTIKQDTDVKIIEFVEANAGNVILLNKNEYERLQRDSAWLACLDAAGVDNWQGIEFAAELWRHDPNNPDRGE